MFIKQILEGKEFQIDDCEVIIHDDSVENDDIIPT